MEYRVYFNGLEIDVEADYSEWLPGGDLIFRSGPAKEITGRFIAGSVQGCLAIQGGEPRFVIDPPEPKGTFNPQTGEVTERYSRTGDPEPFGEVK